MESIVGHCCSLSYHWIHIRVHNSPYRWQPSNPFITIPKYGEFQGKSLFSAQSHRQREECWEQNWAEKRSSCPTSLAWEGTPPNTNSAFAFPKFPSRTWTLRRKSHLLTAGRRLLAASSHKSLLPNLPHTFDPRSCTKTTKRLPWSRRGPNFRSDLAALLLTRCDKGAVSRQLPPTTTLAWI